MLKLISGIFIVTAFVGVPSSLFHMLAARTGVERVGAFVAFCLASTLGVMGNSGLTKRRDRRRGFPVEVRKEPQEQQGDS